VCVLLKKILTEGEAKLISVFLNRAIRDSGLAFLVHIWSRPD
jgi:hypothetical protein